MSEASPNLAERREEIRRLILLSARLLDSERFNDFVALFAPDGGYEMSADSPEIGRDMVWLTATRDELAQLLEELPRHVRDPALRSHFVTVDDIAIDGTAATAESAFAVFRTDQRGETNVYAVGRYEDSLRRDEECWKLKQRRVRLTTRLFVTPTPTPL